MVKLYRNVLNIRPQIMDVIWLRIPNNINDIKPHNALRTFVQEH